MKKIIYNSLHTHYISHIFWGNLYSQTSVLQLQEVSSRSSGQIWSKNVICFFVADILPVPGRNLEIAEEQKVERSLAEGCDDCGGENGVKKTPKGSY